MIEALDVRPEDRLLWLSIPDIDSIVDLSVRLERGLMVAIGPADRVYETRRRARECINVMFIPGPPDDVPFQSGFFSKVVSLDCRWAKLATVAREIVRVLIPGGVAYLETTESAPFTSAGLIPAGHAANFRMFQKPRP